MIIRDSQEDTRMRYFYYIYFQRVLYEDEEEPEIDPPMPAPRKSISFSDEVLAADNKKLRGRRGSTQSSGQDWSKQMEGDCAFSV